jgi:hypothetical protein
MKPAARGKNYAGLFWDSLYKVPIFFNHRLASAKSIRKRRKKRGLSFKKIGDDVIPEKWMTS